MTRLALLLLALLALLATSCGKRADEPAASASGAAGAGAKSPARKLALVDRPLTIEWHDLKTSILVRVPDGWESGGGRGNSFSEPTDLPSPSDPFITYFFGNMSCDGECDDGDMQRNMAELWSRHLEALRNPFATMRDPRYDAIRMDVTVLEDTPLPDGRAIAARVTRPAGFTEYPHLDRFTVTCVRHRPGDEFYLDATAQAPLDEEKALWPLLLEACKTPFYR